jgi:hypothetical protein
MCNTYTKKEYELGQGPLNDSFTVAANLRKIGYRAIFLHNTTPQVFIKWLTFVFQHTEKNLVVFYTGHGASIPDRNGDEDDGFDEVMVFDQGYVVDDQLVDLMRTHLRAKRTVLLSDCCHSGSIWDLQSSKKGGLPGNVMSISAAMDNQTAKQTRMNAKDQGIFSYYFWENFTAEKRITSRQMEVKINAVLNRYGQVYTATATNPKMLDEPIFAEGK